MICWIHNWQRVETALLRGGTARSGCAVLAVSEAHRVATDRLINGGLARLIGGGARIPVHRIYNPSTSGWRPTLPVDVDKLVCFSRKGLHRVLAAFAPVRKALPSVRLYIAGYDAGPQPGVHLLGRLPQHEVFRHLREAPPARIRLLVVGHAVGAAHLVDDAASRPPTPPPCFGPSVQSRFRCWWYRMHLPARRSPNSLCFYPRTGRCRGRPDSILSSRRRS